MNRNEKENKMNIIFLDVDGVLNSVSNLIKVYNETHKSHSGYSYPFDPNCLENLKELVAVTKSNLVISSTWRHSQKGIEKLLETLKEYKLDKLVIGCTPVLGTSRGAEIKKYLSDSKFADTVNFVILDDDRDMEDLSQYLIHTDRQVGLTKENVQQAINILVKSHAKENDDFER